MLRAPQRVVQGAVSRQVMDSFHSDPVLKREGECGVALQADPAPNLPTRPLSLGSQCRSLCPDKTVWGHSVGLHSSSSSHLLLPLKLRAWVHFLREARGPLPSFTALS